MKGLLLREFYLLKTNRALLFSLPLIFALCIVLAFKTGTLLGICYLPVAAGIIPLIGFPSEEQAHICRYSLTMPVSRRQMVTAKYLTMLLFTLTALLLTAVPVFLTGTFHRDTFGLFDDPAAQDVTVCLRHTAEWLLLGFLPPLLINAVLMPLCYRFGAQKMRLLMIVLYAAAGTFSHILIMFDYPADYISYMRSWENGRILLFLAPLLISGVMWLSWKLSVRGFEAREY